MCFLRAMAAALLCGGGESDSQNGWTALMRAAEHGRADCVRLLIDSGADKDAKDNVRRRFSLLTAFSQVFFFIYRTVCGTFSFCSSFLP